MNSRTIVTSHPPVACDVCERRLLRGEEPELFLAAGQPRIVCELCAPRAAHQGWKRESEHVAGNAAPVRARRGRSILERLRSGARPAGAGLAASGGADAGLDEVGVDLEEELAGDAHGGAIARAPESSAGSDPLARALDLFNAGEYPRRIGGVARSLGPPAVNVRELEVVGLVSIVVAWELCWYRYRVDLDDPGAGASLIAQGTELSELPPEECEANGQADESGALHLIKVA